MLMLLLFFFCKMGQYLFLLTQKEQSGCHDDDDKEGCFTFHVARRVTSVVAYVRNFVLYRPHLGRFSCFVRLVELLKTW